jgi:hypothetical protein
MMSRLRRRASPAVARPREGLGTLSGFPSQMSSRRRFLHVGCAGALAWPLVGRSAALAAAPTPQRLVVVFTPNGFLRDQWLPRGEERDFQLNATMAPLEPFRDQLIIVDGLYNQAAERSRGPIVERGLATLLTGRERLPNAAAGPSLDQAVAQLPAGRLRPTLQLGVKTDGRAPGQVAVSYLETGQALLPEHNPQRAQQGLFMPNGNPRPADRATAAALAATEKNLQLVRRSLSAEDSRTLDGHLAGITELRTRVASTGSVCATLPGPALADSNDVQTMGRAQIDVVAQALACDAVRVATLVFEGAAGNARFFGDERGHHDLALLARTDAQARRRLGMIERALMEQFAHLLQRLREPDSTGRPLLDSTLVLLCTDVTRVGSGSFGPLPFLLVGRAGRNIAGGRFMRYSRRPHNDLLLSIYNLFGGGADSFGTRTTGPLPGLFV